MNMACLTTAVLNMIDNLVCTRMCVFPANPHTCPLFRWYFVGDLGLLQHGQGSW